MQKDDVDPTVGDRASPKELVETEGTGVVLRAKARLENILESR